MNAPVSKGKPLKIRKLGNSLGVVPTKDLLDALGVGRGIRTTLCRRRRASSSTPTIRSSLQCLTPIATKRVATGIRSKNCRTDAYAHVADIRDDRSDSQRALSMFGGGAGLRDRRLLENALDQPKNLYAYRPDVSVFEMAAALCVGVVKNRAFVDGNERTALLEVHAFLFLRGWRFDPDQREEVETMVGVASGEIREDMLMAWLKASSHAA